MTDREFLMALSDMCVELRDQARVQSKENADIGKDIDSYIGCGLLSAFDFTRIVINAHLSKEEETCHAS